MIKFGPSGNSQSFYDEGYDGSEQSAIFCKERGLDCFEYSFGRGVRMSDAKAESIARAFKECGIEISGSRAVFYKFRKPRRRDGAKIFRVRHGQRENAIPHGRKQARIPPRNHGQNDEGGRRGTDERQAQKASRYNL